MTLKRKKTSLAKNFILCVDFLLNDKITKSFLLNILLIVFLCILFFVTGNFLSNLAMSRKNSSPSADDIQKPQPIHFEHLVNKELQVIDQLEESTVRNLQIALLANNEELFIKYLSTFSNSDLNRVTSYYKDQLFNRLNYALDNRIWFEAERILKILLYINSRFDPGPYGVGEDLRSPFNNYEINKLLVLEFLFENHNSLYISPQFDELIDLVLYEKITPQNLENFFVTDDRNIDEASEYFASILLFRSGNFKDAVSRLSALENSTNNLKLKDLCLLVHARAIFWEEKSKELGARSKSANQELMLIKSKISRASFKSDLDFYIRNLSLNK